MIDNNSTLKDAGAAVTSSGYGTVDSAANVINLGKGHLRGNVIVDVSAIKISAKNELYRLCLMGGKDADFTGETVLAQKDIGPKAVTQGNVDSKAGRFIIPFQNSERGIIYPYCRIKHVLSGSSPSLTYSARLETDLPQTGSTALVTETTTTSSTTTTTA